MTSAKLTAMLFRIVVPMAATVLLGGCNMMQRLSEIGDQPAMTKIENPVTREEYQPVSLPMPRPVTVAYAPTRSGGPAPAPSSAISGRRASATS